ncbi:MAG: MerR family transcriptional regulator [Clostridium sp.]
MKISELAKLTGITVRTLHHYDKIGLLVPTEITENGYRVYSKESLETLQQILFFKELDFSLKEIKEIMGNKNYNKEEALIKQRELLMKKRERLEGIIGLINKSIKGEENMSFKEFNNLEIEETKKKYAKEVKSKWGETDAYKECEAKTKSYSKDKWGETFDEGSKILKAFSEIKEGSPESTDAQRLVEEWRGYITKSFYNCTIEILSGLGQMYVYDERFKNNIDTNGEGTAEFIWKAIEIYCSK